MQSRVGGSSRPLRNVYLFGHDDEIITAIERYLSDSGWMPARITDAQEVVAQCKRNAPSALLVDGRLDDFDIVEMLVSVRELPSPPFVLFCISGSNADDERFAMRFLGIGKLIVRPCRFSDIAGAMEDAERSPSGAVARDHALGLPTASGGGA